MAKVVEAETTPIFCCEYSCLYRRPTQMICAMTDLCAAPAMEPERGKNPALGLRIRGFVCHCRIMSASSAPNHGLAAGLGLGLTNLAAKSRAPYINLLMRKIQILPLKT